MSSTSVLVELLRTFAEQHDDVTGLLLHGSVAAGSQSNLSDIDLCFICRSEDSVGTVQKALSSAAYLSEQKDNRFSVVYSMPSHAPPVKTVNFLLDNETGVSPLKIDAECVSDVLEIVPFLIATGLGSKDVERVVVCDKTPSKQLTAQLFQYLGQERAEHTAVEFTIRHHVNRFVEAFDLCPRRFLQNDLFRFHFDLRILHHHLLVLELILHGERTHLYTPKHAIERPFSTLAETLPVSVDQFYWNEKFMANVFRQYAACFMEICELLNSQHIDIDFPLSEEHFPHQVKRRPIKSKGSDAQIDTVGIFRLLGHVLCKLFPKYFQGQDVEHVIYPKPEIEILFNEYASMSETTSKHRSLVPGLTVITVTRSRPLQLLQAVLSVSEQVQCLQQRAPAEPEMKASACTGAESIQYLICGDDCPFLAELVPVLRRVTDVATKQPGTPQLHLRCYNVRRQQHWSIGTLSSRLAHLRNHIVRTWVDTEYVAFLDDDCCYPPGQLHKLYASMRGNNLDACHIHEKARTIAPASARQNTPSTWKSTDEWQQLESEQAAQNKLCEYTGKDQIEQASQWLLRTDFALKYPFPEEIDHEQEQQGLTQDVLWQRLIFRDSAAIKMGCAEQIISTIEA